MAAMASTKALRASQQENDQPLSTILSSIASQLDHISMTQDQIAHSQEESIQSATKRILSALALEKTPQSHAIQKHPRRSLKEAVTALVMKGDRPLKMSRLSAIISSAKKTKTTEMLEDLAQTQHSVPVHRQIQYGHTWYRRLLHTLLFMSFMLELFEVTLLILSCDAETTRAGMFLFAFSLSSAIYAIEIYLNFYTPTFRGSIILDDLRDLPFIRTQYLKGWFCFDVIMCIPWDLLVAAGSAASFNTLQCAGMFGIYAFSWVHWLRALRAIRLPTLFPKSNLLEESPRAVRGLRVVASAVIMIHFWACVGLLIGKQLGDREISIIPPGDSTVAKYINAMIWATQTLFHGVYVPPSSMLTRLVNFVLVLLGYCFTITMGAIAAAFFVNNDSFSYETARRKERLDAVLKRNAVPWNVQKSVHAIYPALCNLSLRDYRDALSELPEGVAQSVQHHINIRLLKNVPMFRRISHVCCEAMALVSTFRTVAAQQMVKKFGEGITSVCLIAHGVAQMREKQDDSEELKAINLLTGDFYGEEAFLSSTPSLQQKSVRAVTTCELIEIQHSDFMQVVQFFPELAQELNTIVHKQRQRTKVRDTVLSVVKASRKFKQVDGDNDSVESPTAMSPGEIITEPLPTNVETLQELHVSGPFAEKHRAPSTLKMDVQDVQEMADICNEWAPVTGNPSRPFQPARAWLPDFSTGESIAASRLYCPPSSYLP